MNTPPPDPWLDDILALVRRSIGPRTHVSVAEARGIVDAFLFAASPCLDAASLAQLHEEAETLLDLLPKMDKGNDTLH